MVITKKLCTGTLMAAVWFIGKMKEFIEQYSSLDSSFFVHVLLEKSRMSLIFHKSKWEQYFNSKLTLRPISKVN